jgi:precorrin-6Y C5,15-methyltransferase (decarboxylating)
VGVGAEGEPGLGAAARAAIAQATLVAGSTRQLSLVKGLLHGETLAWPSPLSAGIAQVLARRGQATCILASGDPFFYGLGATLSAQLSADEFLCHPAPSSLSLAAARLGWPLQQADVVSLHGRELQTIVRHLQPGRRVLALSWDGDTPAKLAALLDARGFGSSRMHVLETLGGPEERIQQCSARDFALGKVADLNVIALEVQADPGSFCLPSRASLPDSAYEHDGQLTKQDIRAITLSALAPYAGALLWDVGAGSGSVGIEWMLSHPDCRAIAVEREPARCARIRRNALSLGVPGLSVVEGAAQQALSELATPDAVFIGGGGGDPALFEACFAALRPGGRLVMNSVSLETELLLLTLHARHGGELRRIAVETVAPLGAMLAFRPAMTVVQWRVHKP